MGKYAELVVGLDNPIQKEDGWLYYIKGNEKGDKKVVGIFRSPMKKLMMRYPEKFQKK